jgi:NADPH:quinone reductase-like Zn-dependent oxidoreductase
VLQFTQVAKPTPNDNEVLIRVYAASVNPLDWHLMPTVETIGRPVTEIITLIATANFLVHTLLN